MVKVDCNDGDAATHTVWLVTGANRGMGFQYVAQVSAYLWTSCAGYLVSWLMSDTS